MATASPFAEALALREQFKQLSDRDLLYAGLLAQCLYADRMMGGGMLPPHITKRLCDWTRKAVHSHLTDKRIDEESN